MGLEDDLGEDTCFENKAVKGPDGCARPAPSVANCNRGVWEVFRRAISGDGVVFAGMDGVPVGVRPESLEAIARALAVPWTEYTLDCLAIVEGYWRKEIKEQVEARREEAKKPK